LLAGATPSIWARTIGIAANVKADIFTAVDRATNMDARNGKIL
jgi:hypothetical protein